MSVACQSLGSESDSEMLFRGRVTVFANRRLHTTKTVKQNHFHGLPRDKTKILLVKIGDSG